MRVAHLPLFVLVFLSTLIAATSNATEMVEYDEGDDDIEFFIPSDRSVSVVPVSAPIVPVATGSINGKRKIGDAEDGIESSSMQSSSKPRVGVDSFNSISTPSAAPLTGPNEALRQNHRVVPAKIRRRTSTDSANGVVRKGRPSKKAAAENSISPSASSMDGRSPAGTATGSGFSSSASSLDGFDPSVVPIGICNQQDFDLLLNQIVNSKNIHNISASLDKIETPLRFTPRMQNDLLEMTMKHTKDSIMILLLKFGIRLQFDHIIVRDQIKEYFKAWILAPKKKSSCTFRAVFLDSDPVGFMKLYISTYEAFPNSEILLNFSTFLKSIDGSVDPEAIQLAAEEAAELQSLSFFSALFESDLMLRMIDFKKLIKLFSRKREGEQANYEALLMAITKDRKLTPPYTKNIIVSAADAKSIDFFQAASDHLVNIFDWEFIINAIVASLHHKGFAIVYLILSKKGYKCPENRFRVLSEDNFYEYIARFANEFIFEMLLNTVLYDGTTMLISDLGVSKIYSLAGKHGNIDIVNYLLSKKYFDLNDRFYQKSMYLLSSKYFDLNDRFHQKSIFRIALEHGQFALARHLIRVHNYSVFDSDSSHYNPSVLGGDSLIYVARGDMNHNMFRLLLKLGANPNVRVAPNADLSSEPEKLIYYCIKSGFLKLTRLLLEYKCTFNAEKALAYNISVNSTEMAILLFNEFKQNQIQ